MLHAAWRSPVRGLRQLHRRAYHQHQAGGVPAVKGQLEDAFVLDDRADAGAADVHQRRRRFDGDRLLERAELEGGVDRRRRADLQHDAGLHVGAESLQRHLEPVRAGRQVRDQIGAVLVGYGRADQPRGGLRRGDGDTWQHRTARIGHTAIEFGRGQLRPRGR